MKFEDYTPEVSAKQVARALSELPPYSGLRDAHDSNRDEP